MSRILGLRYKVEMGESQEAEEKASCLDSVEDFKPRVYRARWLMLILFSVFSCTTAYQWIHLNIVANVVIEYYNGSLPSSQQQKETTVDWLSLVYLLVYLPSVFPVMMLLNKKGLRVNNIVGSLINAVGSWLKVCGLSPGRFWLVMCGQVLCALAEVFAVSVPPRIAAVWFGPNEVSTATSIGVFGNQIGVAIGFVVPPMLVANHNSTDASTGFTIMYYGTAAVTTGLLFLMIIVFKEQPLEPPSHSQYLAKQQVDQHNYWRTIQNLISNVSFDILAVSYGLLTGTFYAISTLLNPIILTYFPGEEKHAGQIGLVIVLTGIVGAILAGIWLDKSKAFKWTSVGVYALSLVGMILFTALISLDLGYISLVYLAAGFLGFFMTGYLPVGYAFASEITYPECEATSSGILTASAMFFGIVLTLGMRLVMQNTSALAAALVLTGATVLGLVLTLFIRPEYKRQQAERQILEKYGHFEMSVSPEGTVDRREITPLNS